MRCVQNKAKIMRLLCQWYINEFQAYKHILTLQIPFAMEIQCVDMTSKCIPKRNRTGRKLKNCINVKYPEIFIDRTWYNDDFYEWKSIVSKARIDWNSIQFTFSCDTIQFNIGNPFNCSKFVDASFQLTTKPRSHILKWFDEIDGMSLLVLNCVKFRFQIWYTTYATSWYGNAVYSKYFIQVHCGSPKSVCPARIQDDMILCPLHRASKNLKMSKLDCVHTHTELTGFPSILAKVWAPFLSILFFEYFYIGRDLFSCMYWCVQECKKQSGHAYWAYQYIYNIQMH